MEHPFKKNNEHTQQPEGSDATVVTAKMFFGRDGETPYETPANFLSFGESLRIKEAADWRKLIECLASGMRMDGNPSTGTDAGNRSYVFHRFYKSRAVLGFKMVNGGGMPQLISDYQNGGITIGFTLDDLIEEARKG